MTESNCLSSIQLFGLFLLATSQMWTLPCQEHLGLFAKRLAYPADRMDHSRSLLNHDQHDLRFHLSFSNGDPKVPDLGSDASFLKSCDTFQHVCGEHSHQNTPSRIRQWWQVKLWYKYGRRRLREPTWSITKKAINTDPSSRDSRWKSPGSAEASATQLHAQPSSWFVLGPQKQLAGCLPCKEQTRALAIFSGGVDDIPSGKSNRFAMRNNNILENPWKIVCRWATFPCQVWLVEDRTRMDTVWWIWMYLDCLKHRDSRRFWGMEIRVRCKNDGDLASNKTGCGRKSGSPTQVQSILILGVYACLSWFSWFFFASRTSSSSFNNTSLSKWIYKHANTRCSFTLACRPPPPHHQHQHHHHHHHHHQHHHPPPLKSHIKCVELWLYVAAGQ